MSKMTRHVTIETRTFDCCDLNTDRPWDTISSDLQYMSESSFLQRLHKDDNVISVQGRCGRVVEDEQYCPEHHPKVPLHSSFFHQSLLKTTRGVPSPGSGPSVVVSVPWILKLWYTLVRLFSPCIPLFSWFLMTSTPPFLTHLTFSSFFLVLTPEVVLSQSSSFRR